MKPARTFGPDVVSAHFGHYWVYVAGPLAGADPGRRSCLRAEGPRRGRLRLDGLLRAPCSQMFSAQMRPGTTSSRHIS